MQVAVDAAELLASLDRPAAAHQRSAISPVPPAFDVGGVFAADRDHRLDHIGRAQRAGKGRRHTEAQLP